MVAFQECLVHGTPGVRTLHLVDGEDRERFLRLYLAVSGAWREASELGLGEVAMVLNGLTGRLRGATRIAQKSGSFQVPIDKKVLAWAKLTSDHDWLLPSRRVDVVRRLEATIAASAKHRATSHTLSKEPCSENLVCTPGQVAMVAMMFLAALQPKPPGARPTPLAIIARITTALEKLEKLHEVKPGHDYIDRAGRALLVAYGYSPREAKTIWGNPR